MKLHLPHSLQTAVLTAFASVTIFTIGTATLGAAQDEATSTTYIEDTGFEVLEDDLDVSLGEDETPEPDSAPANHAGYNGVHGSSDDADRDLSVSISVSEGGEDTAPAAATVSGQAASVSGATVADDLGFTTQVTDGTAPAASAPVFQIAAAPAAQQVQAEETATQENTTNTTSSKSSDSSASPLGSNTTGWGTYDPYYYGGLLTSAPSPAKAAPAALGAEQASVIDGFIVQQTLSSWETYKDVKIGNNAHSILTSNNALTFNQGNATSLKNWSIEYKYVWDNNTITGPGATISLNNSSNSANNHLSALIKKVGEEYRLFIGYGTVTEKSTDYILLSNTEGQILTMSYDVGTDTLSISDNNGHTISYLCSNYGDTETTLTSGNVRVFTNNGVDKVYVNSVSGQYAVGNAATVTIEDGTQKSYDEVQVLTSGRTETLHSDGGKDAFIVNGNAQLWLAATNSDPATVSIDSDIYLKGSYTGDNFGLARLDTSSDHTLNLNGDVILGSDVIISSDSEGTDNRGIIAFNGAVNGQGKSLQINVPRYKGSVVQFNGQVNDVSSFSSAADIVIGEGAVINLHNAAVTGSTVASGGTINVTGEASFASLDMNQGDTSTAEVVVKEGGVLTLGAFQKSATATLTLEKGGKADLRGVVWVEGLDGGGAVLGTGTCSIDSADVTLKNVAVSTQGRVDIGNKLEGSTLTVDSYVTLNNAANTLTATTVNGEWLNVRESMQLGEVTVNGGELRLTSSSPVTMASGTINNGGTLKLSQENQFTVTSGAFTFDSGAILDLSALNLTEETPLTLATATGGGSFTEHNLGNIVFNFGAEIVHDNARLVVDGNALKLTFVQPQTDVLYWKGGPGVWDYQAENWHPSSETSASVAFTDGKNLVFSTPGDSRVTITETAITTGDVVVEKGVNLDLSSNGTQLTADKVDVKGNLTVSNVAVTADSLNIERGSRVTADVEGTRKGALTTDVSGAGDVVKKGTGTLTLTGDNKEFSGTVTIEEGTLVAGGNAGTALGGSPNVVLNGGELEGRIAPGGDINITSAKEEATVSADIEVAAGKALTFNTDAGITLTSSGNLSGTGDICKSGTGTLVLNTPNTFTGNLDINAGTVLVSNVGAVSGSSNVTVGTGSNLVFEEDSSAYNIKQITLDRGSTLTFSGAVGLSDTPLLHIDTLDLTSAAAMDFSNIPLDHTGSYVLASVGGIVASEPGIWQPGQELLQFITMQGINGTARTQDTLTSLHYRNGKLILDLRDPNSGFYWQPSDGEVVQSWNETEARWSTNSGLTDNVTFKNGIQGSSTTPPKSVYFLSAGEDGKEVIQVDVGGDTSSTVFINDLVIANGEYWFKAPEGTTKDIHMQTEMLNNFVVREGAIAHFEGVSVADGNFNVIHVCAGAEATVEGMPTWGVYSMNNEGKFSVVSDIYGMENLLGHVDNTGEMSILYKDSPFGLATVGELSNRAGAKLTIAAPILMSDFIGSYGDGTLHNMGELTFDVTGYDQTGLMSTMLPIDGTGSFKTIGAEAAVELSETVVQSSMKLGAGRTEFAGLVTISDSTTVESGATAVLSAGGTLGGVTLESGATLQLEGDGTAPGIYHGGTLVAREYSVLKVDEDASLSLDSYNAGAPATGAIVVGDGTGNPALLTVEGETNAASLTVYNGEAHLHGGGTVTSLTQSGGTARFCSDAHLGGGTVSGGTLLVEDGQELTVGSVINVTGGSYTVADTAGIINASELELKKTMDNIQYHEAVSGTATETQSGFLSGGEQYVKVFDLATGATLTPNGATVFHKDAAAPMTLNAQGIGYLDTSETVYASYYVRDNYVAGVPDSRVPDYVKLSDVMEASKNGGTTPQLQTVVFDVTDYNDGEVVTGSITVDVQDQHADLFDVKTGAVGVVSIGEDADKTPVMLCCCEEFGSVDGQMLIAGTGIYQLENRGTLGGNVSLLAETKEGIGPWTGTVRITGSGEDLVMAPLAVGSGATASEIEFSHWTGSFDHTAGQTVVSNAKILLTGTGLDAPAAITLTPGNADMVWTNTVQGDNGRINHGQEGDFTLLMTGDTSGWDGVFSQSAAETTVTLGFMDNVSASGTQSAEMQASNGTMNVTYGGNVKTVNGKATVFGQGDMSLTYTGTDMAVNGTIQQFQQQGKLALTVGDGTNAASATFSGVFDSTDNATMTVKAGSTATINTDAALLRVVGEQGSSVNVADGKTLSLSSTDPEASYSEFHSLTNNGTIEMQAAGGDIKLVDDSTDGKTYNLGDLELTGTPGTAAIETSGVNGQTTNVNITALSGSTNVLKLTNDNAAGTVNYNLGGGTAFSGTIEFGSDGAAGDANVVLDSNGVAANAVLKSTGDSSGTADVVVNTAYAQVLGIDSTGSVDGKLYGVDSQRVVTVTGDGTYSYNGALGQNLDVAYTGSGKQTFEGGVDGFRGAVKVESAAEGPGTLAIQNLMNGASVKISDLTIGANDTLDLNDGSNVGTAEVSGSVVAKGGSTSSGTGTASKLDGNLTLGSGATYDVSAAGGTGGLDLGGALTINKGAMMSANDMPAIFQMKIGDKYDLAFDVTSFNNHAEELSFTAGTAIDASKLFGDSQFWEGEYYVCYTGAGASGGNGSNVGTVYLYKAMPEPTTGTLSLLALCALAARRRRK